MIAAMAENRVIGRDNQLPWHLPADLAHFKRLTLGHTLIMGRRTYESIGRPLPQRRSIVVSRNPTFTAPGVEVASSLDAALQLAAGDAEVFVIGGAELFRLAWPRAQRLYLTRVHAEVPGDTFLPELDAGWQLVDEELRPADEKNPYDLSFQTYQRP